tara:strand:+ start:250 stop:504 length:255 start_codon:yes stop_codon:yes gene_type:complete
MNRNETVEEYLKRGGKITTLSPSPTFLHPIAESIYVGGKSSRSDSQAEMIPTVPWRELHDRVESNDPKYWKKLNKRMDKILKKT